MRIWKVKKLWGCGNITDDVYYNDLLSNWILRNITITMDNAVPNMSMNYNTLSMITDIHFNETDFRKIYVGELLQYLSGAAVKIQSIVRRNISIARVANIKHSLNAISNSRKQATVRIIEYRGGKHPHGPFKSGKAKHNQKSLDGSTVLGGTSCTSSITTSGMDYSEDEDRDSPFHPEFHAHMHHHGSNNHDNTDPIDRRNAHIHAHGTNEPHHSHVHSRGTHDPIDRHISPSFPSIPSVQLKQLIDKHNAEIALLDDEEAYTTPYGATYLLSPTVPYKITKYKNNTSVNSLAVT